MRIALVVSVLLLTRPVLAAPPEVDVAALCAELAWTGVRTSAAILRECRRWEDEARQDAEAGWGLLPEVDRCHCRRLTRSNGTGSYRALAMCVRATPGDDRQGGR